ncbi:SH3 domain-containing protein [Amaricoccus sp. W119]|uniref:SH3 domain-containing protein n=1 Tax=Amaricoccus sp. W119 TaxID=3391833 RepID=UPI0039A5EE49
MRRLLTTITLAAVALIAANLPAATPRARAQDLPPGLYDVARVQTRLNVRAAPALDAPVIGWLARDAAGIEVVARDAAGAWGRVNLIERSGWVSLDYLDAREDDLWAANALPATLRCFGTEPFWDLSHEGERLIGDGVDEAAKREFMIDGVAGAAGAASRVVVARDQHGTVTLGIAPEECGDGMSERVYGLGARLSEGNAPTRTGCCSIAAR